uniref:Response regulator receiver domain-containing protein n=1 Tax=Candidatus Kentrum sp. MB TaxID=2138164 RepID=A0A450XA58_9GAMM|nr:MAG: Response regulator receiver domain-containing protein [Candidatus Kentron sp. MB]
MTGEMMDFIDVRMLVVEDNPRYGEQLRGFLQKRSNREIELAENPRQASERLGELFDVIIADMRFGDDVKGGFSVLREVKARNITSIVIILTANDNWQDCRDAFRGGAWDYLSKNMHGNVFDILRKSLMEAVAYAKQYGNRSDELWIKSNIAKLRQDYPNRYIAVMNNTVIHNEESEEELIARIRERKLPLLVPVIEYMAVEDIRKLPVEDAIKRGEGEHVEFKRTFRGARDEGMKDDPQRAVLETIGAFLNSEGGVLLIGVEDNGEVLGLERDYPSLGRDNNWDGFSQALNNSIADRIGAAFAQYIDIDRYVLDGKEIAVVRVEKASSPAFVRAQNKKSFPIRAGATTRALDVEETCHYLKDRMAWVMK